MFINVLTSGKKKRKEKRESEFFSLFRLKKSIVFWFIYKCE